MTKQEKKNILFSERCKKITEKWKKWDSEIKAKKQFPEVFEMLKQDKKNDAEMAERINRKIKEVANDKM